MCLYKPFNAELVLVTECLYTVRGITKRPRRLPSRCPLGAEVSSSRAAAAAAEPELPLFG